MSDSVDVGLGDVLIEVFGLGYVGLPLAVKLAMSGFRVIGIDKDAAKLRRLGEGRLFDSESFLAGDLASCSGKTLIFAPSPSGGEHDAPKIGIVCVPTPVPSDGTPSDVHVRDAVESFLVGARSGDVVILESSVEVGTTGKIRDLIESKGFSVGRDFGLAFCPERIDPKNAKWRLDNIPRVIYCSDEDTWRSCQRVYGGINGANLKRVPTPETAEIVKSFENAFRLVNISLVNELAMLCDKLGVSVREVIGAAATKPFGFMPFYPGAGAGGHCIPKDPRFLLESAKKSGIRLETLQNALATNTDVITYISAEIVSTLDLNGLPRSAIVCGLTYKPDIEDMRDSPGFKLAESLARSRVHVATYDPFYSADSERRYMAENGIDHASVSFKALDRLSKESVDGFGCLCIVQHHMRARFDVDQIVRGGHVPFVYDCQGKIRDGGSGSPVILKKFGN